jgi:biopolymer transport protein ExbD
MKFHRHKEDDPEINLIAFIDVLLVVLIFLMMSTTYSKFTELQITLPSAQSDPLRDRPSEVIVGVSADGNYVVNKQRMDGRSVDALSQALTQAALGLKEPTVIISADANAAHQSVMNVLDAARRSGLARITYATQKGAE